MVVVIFFKGLDVLSWWYSISHV